MVSLKTVLYFCVVCIVCVICVVCSTHGRADHLYLCGMMHRLRN
uniref:Uncharacterized protein n=1 Tax=Anguilla anguilla TaxID=7936 RepID=A0A0E9QK51_ANGAN